MERRTRRRSRSGWRRCRARLRNRREATLERGAGVLSFPAVGLRCGGDQSAVFMAGKAVRRMASGAGLTKLVIGAVAVRLYNHSLCTRERRRGAARSHQRAQRRDRRAGRAYYPSCVRPADASAAWRFTLS